MKRVVPVETDRQLAQLKTLLLEYAGSLGFDLGFQNFQQEMANLPGEYAPPEGSMLLSTVGTEVAGCVALRKLGEDLCEMKRLYVRPGFRSEGIGRALATAIVEEGRRIGYARMRLDTVPGMVEAIGLYRSMGFREIDRYRYNPMKGAIFLELDLKREMERGYQQ